MRSDKSGFTKKDLDDVITRRGTAKEAKQAMQQLIGKGKAKRLKGGWIQLFIPISECPKCLQERMEQFDEGPSGIIDRFTFDLT